MPNMVLNRKHTLSTLSGHVIRFEKGVPVYVPPTIVEQALSIGAEPVDEDGKKEIGDELQRKEEKPRPEVPAGAVRRGKVKEVLEGIMARNERDDFAASGRPKLTSVNSQLTFKATASEVEEIWNELTTERKNVEA